MVRPTANLRLFAAIYPPIEVARTLLESLDQVDLPAHRRTPPHQVHMTLQFIGDTPVKAMDRVVESVERATGGIAEFDLGPQQLIRLPERGPGRLIALQTDGPPSLLALHRRLATRLARRPRRNAGDRFAPHLTLCRFSAPTKSLVKLPQVDIAPFHVDRVRLMRSTLSPDGAAHHEVASLVLAG